MSVHTLNTGTYVSQDQGVKGKFWLPSGLLLDSMMSVYIWRLMFLQTGVASYVKAWQVSNISRQHLKSPFAVRRTYSDFLFDGICPVCRSSVAAVCTSNAITTSVYSSKQTAHFLQYSGWLCWGYLEAMVQLCAYIDTAHQEKKRQYSDLKTYEPLISA